MPKESALVRKITLAVRSMYPRSYVRKLSDKCTRGLPDLIIVCPRWDTVESRIGQDHFFLAVECKTETGRQTHLQRLEMEEINNIPGALYIVARSVDEVLSTMVKLGAVP